MFRGLLRRIASKNKQVIVKITFYTTFHHFLCILLDEQWSIMHILLLCSYFISHPASLVIIIVIIIIYVEIVNISLHDILYQNSLITVSKLDIGTTYTWSINMYTP